MARLLSTSPILRTADMSRTAAHYRRLGFSVQVHGGGYGTAARDGFHLHFHEVEGGGAGESGEVYFGVDDAEALHAEWVAAGVGKTGDLFDPGFGVREAAHTDPDGNIIRFGSPAAAPVLDVAGE